MDGGYNSWLLVPAALKVVTHGNGSAPQTTSWAGSSCVESFACWIGLLSCLRHLDQPAVFPAACYWAVGGAYSHMYIAHHPSAHAWCYRKH